jgi:anti-sigma-K factor RskA
VIDLHDAAARDTGAAEYVLGTLDAEDQAAVEAALPRDGALRAAVYAWQDRLLALTARAAPAQPGPSLWARIEQALGGRPARPAAAARAPWWQGLRLWQGLSAAGVAASLLLAALLVLRAPEPAAARYVALLQSPQDQTTGWVVELQAGRGLRLVPVGDSAAPPPGRALQFWTKAEGAAAPTSLGLVRPGQVVELPLARLPAVEARQLFEITLEPEGGSPIGRPTGPILYIGRTVAL